MTIWTRKFSVIALAAGLAFGTAACDDDDTVDFVTTTSVSTTSTSSTSTTSNTVGSTTTSSVSSTTSSSTSSTTSVTVTSSSSTTTTLGGGAACDCNVTTSVTSADTLGSLQFDTDYSGDPGGGSFEGSGAGVNCTALAGDFTAFNDIDASSTLSTATISTAGFTGPIDVTECNYQTSNAALAPADFAVTVTDASAPDFTPLTPTVEISSVNCVCTGGGSSTTTTAGGTTTTSVTTTSVVGGSTTTTLAGGGGFNIEFTVDDANTYGALQWVADYSGAGGDFVGMADMVACTSPLSAGGAFVTFNDEDATMNLNFAAVALAGFAGPTVVANCEFASAAEPAPGDFVITVVDASDPSLNPIDPLPGVSVSGVTALP